MRLGEDDRDERTGRVSARSGHTLMIGPAGRRLIGEQSDSAPYELPAPGNDESPGSRQGLRPARLRGSVARASRRMTLRHDPVESPPSRAVVRRRPLIVRAEHTTFTRALARACGVGHRAAGARAGERSGRGAYAGTESRFEAGASTQLLRFVFRTSLSGAVGLIETRRLPSPGACSTPSSARPILAGQVLGAPGDRAPPGAHHRARFAAGLRRRAGRSARNRGGDPLVRARGHRRRRPARKPRAAQRSSEHRRTSAV